MDAYAAYAIAVSALVFSAAALYLRYLRKRSEKAAPAPFLNPAGKRSKK